MTTYSAAKLATLGGLTLALLSPNLTLAGSEQTASAEGSQNLVHRVSHSLADAKSYTRSGNAGYKWGKTTQPATATSEWADNTPAQAGYKWGKADTQPEVETYADNAGYQWGSMSFSEQSAYNWGLRYFADQSAYSWGLPLLRRPVCLQVGPS